MMLSEETDRSGTVISKILGEVREKYCIHETGPRKGKTMLLEFKYIIAGIKSA